MADQNEYLAAILQELRMQRNAVMGEDPLPKTHDENGNIIQDWLQIPFNGVVPANGQLPITQNIPADFHFNLLYITGVASVLPADLTLTIRDNSTDSYMQYNGNPVEWENVIGTAPAGGMSSANAPYSLFGLRRYTARGSITIDLWNVNVANQTVEIVLHGIKVRVPSGNF